MKTPEWVLANVRECHHSTICCNSVEKSGKLGQPDYVCDKGSRRLGEGPPCRLLMEETCDAKEVFPESMND